MTDYSQSGEQAIILKALGYQPGFNGVAEIIAGGPLTGKFLDIGAWHPKTFSNTRALYELGWSGVMVEPSPGPMRDLLKEYGRDGRITLIQALISLNHRTLALLHVTDDALSTTDEGLRKAWGERGGYFGKLWVPQVPLGQLLSGDPFDFINIDAEGQSGKLFLEVLYLGTPMPQCICVEHDGSAEEMREVGKKCGYRNAQECGVNLILWR